MRRSLLRVDYVENGLQHADDGAVGAVYVGTEDGSSWRIVNGKIHKFTKAEIGKMRKEEAKKN